MIYPKPYSMYLRGTIEFGFMGLRWGFRVFSFALYSMGPCRWVSKQCAEESEARYGVQLARG